MAHTPTPWFVDTNPNTGQWQILKYPHSGPCLAVFIGEPIPGFGNIAEENVRQTVRAVNAFEPMRELLFRAIVELEYVRSVENCDSGLCASAEGAEIIDEGMKLLGVKDLSENALALAETETPLL